MNKKADLLDNTVETIVAVVGILLLIGGIGYIGYRLITSGDYQAEENAKYTADILQAKLNALKDGDTTSFLLQKLKGNWYVHGWGKNNREKPERCYFDTCICVCEGTTSAICQNTRTGFCRTLEAEEILIEEKIFTPAKAVSGGTGGASTIPASTKTNSYISLKAGGENVDLVELTISRTENSLSVKTSQEEK